MFTLNDLFNPSERNIVNKFAPTIKAINDREYEIQTLSDAQIQERMRSLILRYQREENMTNVLEESFALTREASKRTLGLRHFDTQLMGGLVLNSGKLAEMKTGEGKTLVATLPASYNALSLKGVHIVTVNDYLARRDQRWMGQLYRFLGLSVGLVQENQNSVIRKKNYSADITYVTNSELAFDYLRDNMATEPSELVQRPFNYAIVDEVDSILIDEARTPLIISGVSDTPVEKYVAADEVVNYLKPSVHFTIDEKAKNATLTSQGIVQVQELLQTEDLYDTQDPWVPFILNSVKARTLFTKDVNYIVKNREIQIVDEFTGRIMPDRRWSDGLHQAIEAKEQVPILKGSETLASITYQNFFLLYPKLSGMTGTAKTAEVELEKIYNLEVNVLPTTKKIARKDVPDLVYKDEFAKWKAVARECEQLHQTGIPILIGTTSIEKSEIISQLLSEREISHQLLNAKPENIKRESEVVAQAGCRFAVTVATNMAGRGTDILLGGNPDFKARKTILDLFKYIITLDKSEIAKLNFKEVFSLPYAKDYCGDFESILKIFIKEGITTSQILENIVLLRITKIDLLEKILLNVVENGVEDSGESIYKTINILYDYFYSKYKEISELEKEEIKKLGGLFIIGTERHESQRIDNQLRGRAGRQGDPGCSKFILSLDDNLFRIFGGDKIKNMMAQFNLTEDTPLEASFLTSALNSAQEKVEAFYYDTRKRVFDYDDVLNKQRQAIFKERQTILNYDSVRTEMLLYGEDLIISLVRDLKLLASKPESSLDKAEFDKLNTEISYIIGVPYLIVSFEEVANLNLDQLCCFFIAQFWLTYDLKEIEFETRSPGLIRLLEKSSLLSQIDIAWKSHLQKMDILRDSIGWRSYGQLDPLLEYKNEAFNLFIDTTREIKYNAIYNVLKSRIV
jgi:preprotein translocase subunit SecA|tara:strand:+ start:1890 stop:4625 length:2736 start_codon:yes stop_codon:yes gene_type:complete